LLSVSICGAYGGQRTGLILTYHSGLFCKSISTSSYLTPVSNNAILTLCAHGHDLLLYSLIGFSGSIDILEVENFPSLPLLVYRLGSQLRRVVRGFGAIAIMLATNPSFIGQNWITNTLKVGHATANPRVRGRMERGAIVIKIVYGAVPANIGKRFSDVFNSRAPSGGAHRSQGTFCTTRALKARLRGNCPSIA